VSACGDNQELRSEVESLLDSDAALGDFIERPPAELRQFFSEQPACAVQIGMRVGAYELVQELGSGGMGTVYLAKRADAQFQKNVAIKLIRKGMESELVVARFRKERQILASLEHANIARLLDAGVTADGQPFLVMEYIEGRPIDQYCDAHLAGIRERIVLFREVCAAVEYAHRNLVIHRDLKPGNVLVLAEGRVKLLDFGIATLLHGERGAAGPSTRTGMPFMTPEYASPEQLRGEPVTTTSDVYSLGVILYRLLAGRHPCPVAGSSLWEIQEIICREDPLKPSTVVAQAAGQSAGSVHIYPRLAIRQLRGDLDNIALKAIRKEPSQRYSSVEALNEDLRRYFAREPVSAHPPGFTYTSAKFLRRHRSAVLVMSLLLVSLIGGMVATSQLARRAEQERARADNEAARATAVNNFLQNDLLAQASASVQASPERKPDADLKVRTALDRAAARISGKFDGQPLAEASIRQTIADTYLALGLYPQAQQQVARSIELRRRLLGEDHPDTLTSMHTLALLGWYRGEYPQADSLFTKILQIRQRVLGQEHPDTLSAMNDLALVAWYRGEYARAEPLFSKALEVRRRVLGPEHPGTLSTMNDLAGLYVHQGNYAKAEVLFVNLVDVRRRVLGNEHPNTLLSLNNLAVVYWDEGNYVDAERLLTEVLKVKRRVLGEQHPETLSTTNNLAGLYRDQGQYEKAEPLFTSVLAVRQRLLGQDHPDTFISMNNLALLYLYAGRIAPARVLLNKTLDARRRVLGENHPDTLISLNNLAMLYVHEGSDAIAEPVYVNLIERQRRILGADHPRRIASMNDLGELYLRQHKYDAAEPLAREALNTQQRSAMHTWARYNSETLLGASLLGQHRYREAEQLLMSGYQGMLQRKATIPFDRRSALDIRAEWVRELYRDRRKPNTNEAALSPRPGAAPLQ
jgi:serine/threonine protein kinase